MFKKLIFLIWIIITCLAGANVNADSNLDMDIRGSLTVESQQDTDYARGSNWGVNIGGGAGGGNVGFNTGKSNHDSVSANASRAMRWPRYRTI